MCCGDVGSGLPICGAGSFWGIVGIVLVSVFTLGYGVGFSEDLELWFLCGSVMSVSTLGDPPVFTLWGLYVLLCKFSSLFCVGLLSLLSLIPFGFYRGGVLGLGGVHMTGLNHGESLGALSGLQFFTFGYGSVSQCFISFFSAKILTICCNESCLPSPISSTVFSCACF